MLLLKHPVKQARLQHLLSALCSKQHQVQTVAASHPTGLKHTMMRCRQTCKPMQQ